MEADNRRQLQEVCKGDCGERNHIRIVVTQKVLKLEGVDLIPCKTLLILVFVCNKIHL